MALKLTDRAVRALVPPAKGQAFVWDEDCAGFGVRITKTGAIALVLDYRTKAGQARRQTIGSFGDWTVAKARDAAKAVRRRIDAGEEPMADRAATQVALAAAKVAATVTDLCERWEKDHAPRLRSRAVQPMVERTTASDFPQEWLTPCDGHLNVRFSQRGVVANVALRGRSRSG